MWTRMVIITSIIQGTSHLLDVKVSHSVALGYYCYFFWVLPDQLTEKFDWRTRSICFPFNDSQLSKVSPRVTGQGFAVFKVKPTKLTGCVWHTENKTFLDKYQSWINTLVNQVERDSRVLTRVNSFISHENNSNMLLPLWTTTFTWWLTHIGCYSEYLWHCKRAH